LTVGAAACAGAGFHSQRRGGTTRGTGCRQRRECAWPCSASLQGRGDGGRAEMSRHMREVCVLLVGPSSQLAPALQCVQPGSSSGHRERHAGRRCAQHPPGWQLSGRWRRVCCLRCRSGSCHPVAGSAARGESTQGRCGRERQQGSLEIQMQRPATCIVNPAGPGPACLPDPVHM
jgi:hypothetical protein